MGAAKSATVDAEELRNAFEFVSSGEPLENSAYISLDTGKIYWQSRVMDLDDEELPEDFDTSNRFLAISHKTKLDLGRRLVLSFVDQALPEDFSTVERFFQRRSAPTAVSRICWNHVACSSGGTNLKTTRPIRLCSLGVTRMAFGLLAGSKVATVAPTVTEIASSLRSSQ